MESDNSERTDGQAYETASSGEELGNTSSGDEQPEVLSPTESADTQAYETADEQEDLSSGDEQPEVLSPTESADTQAYETADEQEDLSSVDEKPGFLSPIGQSDAESASIVENLKQQGRDLDKLIADLESETARDDGVGIFPDSDEDDEDDGKDALRAELNAASLPWNKYLASEEQTDATEGKLEGRKQSTESGTQLKNAPKGNQVDEDDNKKGGVAAISSTQDKASTSKSEANQNIRVSAISWAQGEISNLDMEIGDDPFNEAQLGVSAISWAQGEINSPEMEIGDDPFYEAQQDIPEITIGGGRMSLDESVIKMEGDVEGIEKTKVFIDSIPPMILPETFLQTEEGGPFMNMEENMIQSEEEDVMFEYENSHDIGFKQLCLRLLFALASFGFLAGMVILIFRVEDSNPLPDVPSAEPIVFPTPFASNTDNPSKQTVSPSVIFPLTSFPSKSQSPSPAAPSNPPSRLPTMIPTLSPVATPTSNPALPTIPPTLGTIFIPSSPVIPPSAFSLSPLNDGEPPSAVPTRPMPTRPAGITEFDPNLSKPVPKAKKKGRGKKGKDSSVETGAQKATSRLRHRLRR